MSFVEAAILYTRTGAIQIYYPLLINQDAAIEGVDFIASVVLTIATNSAIGIWFGSNAATVTLTGTTQGCVNGLGNSVFGQFAYCNTPEFFRSCTSGHSFGLTQNPTSRHCGQGNWTNMSCDQRLQNSGHGSE